MNKVKSNKTFNSMSKIYLLIEFRKKKKNSFEIMIEIPKI